MARSLVPPPSPLFPRPVKGANTKSVPILITCGLKLLKLSSSGLCHISFPIHSLPGSDSDGNSGSLKVPQCTGAYAFSVTSKITPGHHYFGCAHGTWLGWGFAAYLEDPTRKTDPVGLIKVNDNNNNSGLLMRLFLFPVTLTTAQAADETLCTCLLHPQRLFLR